MDRRRGDRVEFGRSGRSGAPVKSARRRDENADVVGAAQVAHELEQALERGVLLLTLHEASEDAREVVLQAAARQCCMYSYFKLVYTYSTCTVQVYTTS